MLLWLDRHGLAGAAYAEKNVRARTAQGAKQSDDGRVDLLSKLIQAKNDNPEVFDNQALLGMAISMVLAGSETTYVQRSSIAARYMY